MMAHKSTLKKAVSLLLFVAQVASVVGVGTQFASHVSINTPARSFTHGVGDPLPLFGNTNYRQSFNRGSPNLANSMRNRGYPRAKPAVPFNKEDVNTINVSPWQYNNFKDVTIPLLPPSPYKVDSSDPESLWPEGLLVPAFDPQRYTASSNRRSEVLSEGEYLDPYLLEGSQAVAAVKRASGHGLLYFHDIPHIESLLANQQLRVENKLKPHRIASIRHTWPYNRP